MKYIFLFVLLVMTEASFCQQNTITDIISSNNTKTAIYKKHQVAGIFSFTVPCDFGKSELYFSDTVPDCNKVQVIAVDLVYTDYPSDDDLKKLNATRMNHLLNKYPSLNDKSVSWNLIRQMNGSEKDSALKMFHGFVIYYRPLQNEAAILSDTKKLKEMLSPIPGSSAVKHNGFIAADTTHLREQYEIDEYMIVQKLPVKDAIIYLGLDRKEKYNYKNYDSVFVYEKPSTDTDTSKKTYFPPEDSTVIKVLNRMHWNNMLVVADVTASMYLYTGQLLLWMKLNEDERRIHAFAFFNDGDDKNEEEKQAGRTGGIYTTNSSVFEVVEKLAYKTMSNGTGGKIPENNIEALLTAQEACTDCNDVVMIADNCSGISDMSLLNQLRRPVHIIVCGVIDKINTDYLTIARRTRGSVHLLEKDLLNLTDLKEGENIEIYGIKYVIINGQFVISK